MDTSCKNMQNWSKSVCLYWLWCNLVVIEGILSITLMKMTHQMRARVVTLWQSPPGNVGASASSRCRAVEVHQQTHDRQIWAQVFIWACMFECTTLYRGVTCHVGVSWRAACVPVCTHAVNAASLISAHLSPCHGGSVCVYVYICENSEMESVFI